MKKILHFTSSYPREKSDLSGIFIQKLALNCVSEFQIFILTPHCPCTARHEIVNGITVIRFPYFIQKYQRLVYGDSILQNLKRNKWLYLQVPFYIVFSAIYFAAAVRSRRIDLVHAHWIFPHGFVAVLMKRLLNLQCKIIITSHGSDMFSMNGWIFQKLKKYALSYCDKINVVSSAIQDKIIKNFGLTNIARIPMGTEADMFIRAKPKPVEQDYLLFVGRLSEKKGVTYLLDAFRIIRSEGYTLKLVIIGSGNQKKRLEAQAKRLLLNGHVIFADAMEQQKLAAFYQHARVLIGPSISEGFGLVFVEAMLAKCPVVASNIGGIPDLIQHEKTGLLVEQKQPVQIARAVERLLNDPVFSEKIVERAFNYAQQHFTWNAVSKQFKLLYDQVLAEVS